MSVLEHARAPAVTEGSSASSDGPPQWGAQLAVAAVALIVVSAALVRPHVPGLGAYPLIETWFTIFVAISLQAVPFLVLGVAISAAIAAFVPTGWLARALSRESRFSVPAAGLAGALLPGCECGSVPIAARLASRGASTAAALAFMLSAPAINPVVLVSTAVAFPGQPEVVLARFTASLATALVMGLLWRRFGRDRWITVKSRHAHEGGSRVQSFVDVARHDFLHAGGWLVVGAVTTATLQVFVPRNFLDGVAAQPVLAVGALAVLAVLLAVCSEADAFVAASLTQFSLTARLTFMVVGPAVDIKLVALQSGVFGRRFAAQFAPATFAVAVAASVLAGALLLR